ARSRHTRSKRDWSSDVCSSDLVGPGPADEPVVTGPARQGVVAGRAVERHRAGEGGGVERIIARPAGQSGRFDAGEGVGAGPGQGDRKSTRLNSSHVSISYAVFC